MYLSKRQLEEAIDQSNNSPTKNRDNFRSPRLGNTLGFYCFPCLTDSRYWVFLSIPKMGFLHDMGII